MVQSNEPYVRILANTKLFFIPIVNPDGSKFIEERYELTGKIEQKRKNMNPKFISDCGETDAGTDLNRNWGVDWMAMGEQDTFEKCGDFWPGQ